LATEDCIRLITPAQVLQAAVKLLERKKAAALVGNAAFTPEFVSV